MVKIFLGCFIITVCTAIGKKTTAKHKHKLSYYECLLSFNKALKQNLQFKQEDLLNLVNFDYKNQDFNASISSFKLAKQNVFDYQELYYPEFLDKDDRAFLSNYFELLGKGNTKAEMENLVFYEELINEKVCKIADNCSKFSNLGQRLGFAVGMAVFIIIL